MDRQAVQAPAGQADRTAAGGHGACDHTQRGRLAGTVRPDQPEELTVFEPEGHGLEGVDAAEGDRDVFDLEHAGHHSAPSSAALRGREPAVLRTRTSAARPPGLKRITAKSRPP